MIPQKITISGFLSYRDAVEIDFSSFDLACISGANGAGKSSLLDAITWVLFGKARSRDHTLIHLDSNVKAAEVCLIFEYEGNYFRVRRAIPRGRTTVLEFHVAQPHITHWEETGAWKPLTERSVGATQTRIEETLRMDYDTFINASFFLQGKADQFTQQKPSERKRILGSILGLDVWEDYRQRTVERRRDLEGELGAIDGRMLEINAELNEEEPRRAALAALEAELHQIAQLVAAKEAELENARRIAALLNEKRQQVQKLAIELDKTRQRLGDLETRCRERQEEMERYTHVQARDTLITSGYKAWQQARQELEEWEKTADAYREQERRRQAPLTEMEAERARLLQEQNTLEQRQANLNEWLAQIPSLQTQLTAAQAAAQLARQKLERAKTLEEGRETLRQRLAEAKAENPRLAEEMKRLKARLEQLTSEHDAPCPVCGKPLSNSERDTLAAEIEAEGKQKGDRWRENKALLEEAEAQLQELETEIQTLLSAETDLRNSTRNIDQMSTNLEQIEQARTEWETQAAPRLAEVMQLLVEQTYAQSARSQLAQIDAELKTIGYDAAAQGQTAVEEYRLLNVAQANLANLQRELTILQTDLANQRGEAEQRQVAHRDMLAALEEQEAQVPDLQASERALFQQREQENIKRQAIGAAKQKVLVLKDLKQRRTRLESERQTLAMRIEQYRKLERAFSKNGIPALLIEQALPEIEEKANDILAALSDNSMTVAFLTQVRYKNEQRTDLKETLDIQITDGSGTRDYEMYSGGEAFRVNFAIRLALSEVLAQRAGARLQTLVIDEGFGSQDTEGRQRLVETINRVREYFAKILVITHIEEIKELFPARIEVEKTARGSVVKII